MFSKIFPIRIVSFLVALILGVFVASFFVTFSSPRTFLRSFKKERNRDHCDRRFKIKMENQRLNAENERLEQENMRLRNGARFEVKAAEPYAEMPMLTEPEMKEAPLPPAPPAVPKPPRPAR